MTFNPWSGDGLVLAKKIYIWKLYWKRANSRSIVEKTARL
jgi:hypothetical protein